MPKNMGLIAGVAAVVIVGGVIFSQMKSTAPASGTREEAAPMVKDDMMEKDVMAKDDMMKGDAMAKPEADDMMKDDKMAADDMMNKDVMMGGTYEAYAPEKLARAESGDVVLFFHASWCPSCRGLNASIEAGAANIPKDVTILKTDYDTQTELKKKYGVTYQHTMVQVDKDGNLIKKWSGSPSLEALLAQVE